MSEVSVAPEVEEEAERQAEIERKLDELAEAYPEIPRTRLAEMTGQRTRVQGLTIKLLRERGFNWNTGYSDDFRELFDKDVNYRQVVMNDPNLAAEGFFQYLTKKYRLGEQTTSEAA